MDWAAFDLCVNADAEQYCPGLIGTDSIAQWRKMTREAAAQKAAAETAAQSE